MGNYKLLFNQNKDICQCQVDILRPSQSMMKLLEPSLDSKLLFKLNQDKNMLLLRLIAILNRLSQAWYTTSSTMLETMPTSMPRSSYHFHIPVHQLNAKLLPLERLLKTLSKSSEKNEADNVIIKNT